MWKPKPKKKSIHKITYVNNTDSTGTGTYGFMLTRSTDAIIRALRQVHNTIHTYVAGTKAKDALAAIQQI